ncbi:magnesium transporter CorA family protein [Candidatus Kaiserbacteria bacterium]|nr:magnesium transporter CorA family protein [Candidatus Kaiserbacteria bacterium]
MIFRHQYEGGVWVDLEQPTEEEIREVAREFSISEPFEAELLSPTPMPMAAVDSDRILLVLHFPESGAEGATKNQEIDFVVGNRFIVTVRYEIIASLHHLKKILEAQELTHGSVPVTTDVLLEILFAHLYSSVRDHTNHAATQLSRVERDMFDGHEHRTVRAISSVSRAFLNLEAALANQEEPLRRFLEALEKKEFFGDSFAERAQRIFSNRTHVARLVKTHGAVAGELRETNIALLSAKQNEIIKILTVVSFIFLPLALIAKIFAMKATDMPFAEAPNGFWIIIGIMFVVATLLTLFVLKKRWI